METDAPGLQFTSGELEVTVGGQDVTVSATDWNTISSTSSVPHDIGLSLDPDFHAAATTRNRFQYLADLMSQRAEPDKFTSIGIVAKQDGQTLLVIIAVSNSTAHTYRLSDLLVTVTQGPPTTTVGQATVYSGAGNELIVPGQDVYFLRLKLPVLAAAPANPQTTEFSFHYGKLVDCGTSPC